MVSGTTSSSSADRRSRKVHCSARCSGVLARLTWSLCVCSSYWPASSTSLGSPSRPFLQVSYLACFYSAPGWEGWRSGSLEAKRTQPLVPAWIHRLYPASEPTLPLFTRVLLQRSSEVLSSQRNRPLDWLADKLEDEADQPEEPLLLPSTEGEPFGTLSPMRAIVKRYRAMASGSWE